MTKNANEIIVLFGRRLRAVRKKRGLSQEKLATLAGCDISTLGMIERGKRVAGLDTIAKIAQALEISCIELFDFSGAREEEYNMEGLREKFIYLVKDKSLRTMVSVSLDAIERYKTERK